MPTFLSNIDNKFKILLSKEKVSRNDLLELKSLIIEEYEKDTDMDIKKLQESQRILTLNLYDV
jgi:hypothetical protein